jgi:hypothetical protein
MFIIRTAVGGLAVDEEKTPKPNQIRSSSFIKKVLLRPDGKDNLKSFRIIKIGR